MLCLKLRRFIKKKTLNNKDLLLTDQNYQSNHTRLILTAYLNILAVLERFYIDLHFVQKKDTANRHSCSHLMTGTQHIQTCSYKHVCMHTLTLNTGATVRNAARLVRPDEVKYSSTAFVHYKRWCDGSTSKGSCMPPPYPQSETNTSLH